jgi:hypothetical protein
MSRYLLDSWRWMASFFSSCSIGNCGTSYGADISLDRIRGETLPVAMSSRVILENGNPTLDPPNVGLSLPEN